MKSISDAHDKVKARLDEREQDLSVLQRTLEEMQAKVLTVQERRCLSFMFFSS